MRRHQLAIVLWIAGLLAGLAVLVQTRFQADMSAFLPRKPTAQQQLLVDQISKGVLSRTVLMSIEGGGSGERQRLSRDLAARLRQTDLFALVRNGDGNADGRDHEILFSHRYQLSPAVNPERFSVTGLHGAIAHGIDLLASTDAPQLKALFVRDPTGELLEILASLGQQDGPASRDGAWISADGQRAILMAQTRARGTDMDALQTLLDTTRAQFTQAAAAAGISGCVLRMTGAPVFSVDARQTIRSEVRRLSIVSSVAIVLVLLIAYRSLTALVLGLLPVMTGALAGICAVSLGFGSVHGITVGFGSTLIGEAVDYTIYYFVQSEQGSLANDRWLRTFWPTIRLGMLTSVCGFASLLFSGFPGLAQLGLYSIAGLLAAAAVTRFVLPALRPAQFRIAPILGAGVMLQRVCTMLARMKWAVPLVAGLAALVVLTHRDDIWSTGLSGLSPTSSATQQLDHTLRADLGAPDLRYLVVVNDASREATLRDTEMVGHVLQSLVTTGRIAGFDTPSRFLPSRRTQSERIASLPATDILAKRLADALSGLPLRTERLAPFLDDVAAARSMPPLAPDAFAGSTLGLALDTLLFERANGFGALMTLRANPAAPHGEIDVALVRGALASVASGTVMLVDLLDESSRLYQDYLREAIVLSLVGLGSIAALLGLTLRSLHRVARVLAPLGASVLAVTCILVISGERLTLFHLVGMLLIVAVGSNYALFFDRREENVSADPHMLASLALANLTTVIAFGVLGFSGVPVLHAFGATVAPGALLALVFSASLGFRSDAKRSGSASPGDR